jgi:hypothetical protein
VVVFQDSLILFKAIPGDIGWIFVTDTDFPLLYRQTLHRHLPGQRVTLCACFPIHKNSCIGRIFQELENHGNCRFFPYQIPKAILTGEEELFLVEVTKHLVRCSRLLKKLEDQLNPALHFLMRCLDNLPLWRAVQANR